MDNKTMDRMVVEVAVNAARVEGMEAMREAAARECDVLSKYAREKKRENIDEEVMTAILAMEVAYDAAAKAIRALKVEEVLK